MKVRSITMAEAFSKWVKEKKDIRREMGMIFQSGALFDSLSLATKRNVPLDMFSRDIQR